MEKHSTPLGERQVLWHFFSFEGPGMIHLQRMVGLHWQRPRLPTMIFLHGQLKPQAFEHKIDYGQSYDHSDRTAPLGNIYSRVRYERMSQHKQLPLCLRKTGIL